MNLLAFFQVQMSVDDIEFFIECEDDDEDYNGKYAVSNFGNVKNLKTGQILKQSEDKGGYLKVGFYGNNKARPRSVHRLIAKAWILNPSPNEKKLVDHIDRNKQNNSISNLRWVNDQESNLNRDVVEFAKHYWIIHSRTQQRQKKWSVCWRQEGKKKSKFFLTKEEAIAFAKENLEGKSFLQPIDEPKLKPKV